MNNLNWDDLRYFLAVAEQGSLSAAAKELRSNQPTVGRHIDGLEASLSMRLFQRTPMGLSLTQEGTLLLEHAQRVRSGILNIQHLSGGTGPQAHGSVRLALPEGICSEVVVPNLVNFQRASPHVRLILNVSSRTADLTRGDADIAIRLFRPEQPDLVVRRMSQLTLGLFAGRRYAKRHGVPESEAELGQHTVIAYGDDLAGQPENQWLLERVKAERVILCSDSTTTRRQATECGLGISIQPKEFAHGNKQLVAILEDSILPSYPVWLVCHRDLRDVYRVRVVLDFLASLFEQPVAK